MLNSLALILSFFSGLTASTHLLVEVTEQAVQGKNCSRLLDQLESVVGDLSLDWHIATEKHMLFTDVTIEVPHSFLSSDCLAHKKVTHWHSPKTAELKITSDHQEEGLSTVQYGPCGTKGRGVALSSSRLKNSESLLVSLVNNNYGVFLTSIQNVWQVNETRADFAPESRQQLLCYGRSARQIIELSGEDYQTTKEFTSPKFSYVAERQRRAYVLVVQRSYPEFEASLTWETMQSALLPFISSLASGDQLAIITYDQASAELNLPITRLTDDNRALVHAALPRRPLPNQLLSLEACHKCGLDLAQSLAIEEDTQIQPILLVKSGRMTQEQMSHVRLTPHIIGLDRTLDRSWSSLSPYLFVVGQCESPRSCQSSVTSLLMQAGEKSGKYAQHRVHEPNASGFLSGAFALGNVSHSSTIVVTAANERDIASLVVTSPSGRAFAYPFYSHNMAFLHLAEGRMEVGEWRYEAKMYNENDAFDLDIYSCEVREQPPLEAWVDSRVDKLGHPRITIYARSSSTPKSRRLTAYVSRPSHKGKDLPVVISTLADSGTGYPDLRANDRIFSAFFTELSPESGFYQVLVVDDDNDGLRTFSASFHVTQMASSFYVRKEVGSRLLVSDVFPPNRITDLSVVGQIGDAQLFVTLNWTAPGGDFDHGSAFRYEIRCATSAAGLHEDTYAEQSIPVHASLIPEPEVAGVQQRCTVGVPWHNQIFYYGIVAFDASGNRALMSNTVPVIIVKEEDNEVADEVFDEIINAQPISSEGTAAQIGAHIWAPILGVALLSLVIILLVFLRKRRNVSQDEESHYTASTTTSSCSAGVSTVDNLSSLDLSFDHDKDDMWPRIHVMEDCIVYRDLSTMSEVPSEYCRLDRMLSALLASKQKRSESLV